MNKLRFYIHLTSLITLLFLTACSNNAEKETKAPVDTEDKRKLNFGGLFGEDFLTFGGNKKNKGGRYASTVNPYLWRASIETVNFIPLASADAFGGIIVTDWYSPNNTPQERFKVTIFITDQVLRADALKVTIHKQVQSKNGGWITVTPDTTMATQFENIILTKARQIRINNGS